MINEQGLYYYDSVFACWIWTSPGHYPFLYWLAPYNSWVFYYLGTPFGERWFYIYDPGMYLEEAAMRLH